MKRFAALYTSLDTTTKTTLKVAAMRDYFASCEADDAAWAVFFLSGQRLKRLVPSRVLRDAAAVAASIPAWMLEECYDSVGDLAETIALLIPSNTASSSGSLTYWVEQRLRTLANQDDDARREALFAAWRELPPHERFVFNKLVTGAFRVGVSQRLVVRALSQHANVDASVITHRLMGQWHPTAEFFRGLIAADHADADLSRPYPFCLAHPLREESNDLGDRNDWIVEWKWDGIRGQIIRRGGDAFLWSRGEELIHDRFPEINEAMQSLPDGVVLDGEVLGWKDDRVLPFSELQRRIGRKTIGKKILAEVPVRFLAFDLLEENGVDLRDSPLDQRRKRLDDVIERLGDTSTIMASPIIKEPTWEELAAVRQQSREKQVEGFMLKHIDSTYRTGRATGMWWKWKVEPYTCDAVLLYAQKGTGRRASLYTDYTFAVWHNDELVPFAKAYSGLTDDEIAEVDRFVRNNTIDRFGPVRSVSPQLVFEIAFENIQVSKRHKSGIAVRFPRIARWRHDKRPEHADSLVDVQRLMPQTEPKERTKQ